MYGFIFLWENTYWYLSYNQTLESPRWELEIYYI